MTKTETPTNGEGVFSTPRKFDLSTMLVVTTAYATVFAILQAIGAPAMAVLIVATFFTAVALGQAILFDAKHPRWASVLVGSAYFVIFLIAYFLTEQFGSTPAALPRAIMFGTIFGAFWGYVGGVIVGFVFMVAHWVRSVLTSGKFRTDLQDDQTVE